MAESEQECNPIPPNSYAEHLLMIYDLASKEAKEGHLPHKEAFTRVVLIIDNFAAMAEILTRIQIIERETKALAGMGNALFRRGEKNG